MKQKTLTLIIASIFIIGIIGAGVGASRIISNFDKIYIENFIAGSEVQANFSYDYIKGLEENTENSPAILDLTIESDNEDYPVWKNDFEISGLVKRYFILGFFIKEIPFNCSEKSPQTITYSIGSATVYPENGTFYCYNEDGNLELDRHDEVFLNILSDPALYPGQYNLTARLYYLQEEYIHIDITPIVSHVPYGKNTTVKFNMSFEISGGNAIRMKMSDLFEGYYAPDEIIFTIGGANYTVEELNARLVYNGEDYFVGNEYNYLQPPIIFDNDINGIVRGSAMFMMDIKDYMEPGTYHGTYQFNVTKEDL